MDSTANPTAQELSTRELFDTYVMPTYGRLPLTIARGAGCRVWDESGREYLDFGAGIAVCSLGHSAPELVQAIEKQAKTLIHTSNLYYTRPQGLLAKKLVECVGDHGRVFFSNSGAEANEALYKLARKYGNECGKGGRFEIITFDNSFHGRTMAGIAATGQQKVKTGFEPAVPGFKHVPFNDAAAVRAAITPQTVAILLEPIQGEGGVQPADAEFLRKLRQIADEFDLLLMFDEVQSGLGRTGDWCAWKTIGGNDLKADAVSWAKGIGGGYPLGAIWVRDRAAQKTDGTQVSLSQLLGPGSHASTFGGTPLACAAGLAVFESIETNRLLENAKNMGARATAAVQQLQSPWIKDVRGVGLMIGIGLDPDLKEKVAGLAQDARPPALILTGLLSDAGLLSIPAGLNTLRWLPPLNVSAAEVDRAVSILGTVLSKLG